MSKPGALSINFLTILAIYLLTQLGLPWLLATLTPWESTIYKQPSLDLGLLETTLLYSACLVGTFLLLAISFPMKCKRWPSASCPHTLLSLVSLKRLRFYSWSILLVSAFGLFTQLNNYRYGIQSISEIADNVAWQVTVLPIVNISCSFLLLQTILFEHSEAERAKYRISLMVLCVASVLGCNGLASALNSLVLIVFSLMPLKTKFLIFSLRPAPSFIFSISAARSLSLVFLVLFLFLFPFALIGVTVKTTVVDGLPTLQNYGISWLVERTYPQYLSLIASFNSGGHDGLYHLSNYFTNAMFRFSLLLRIAGLLDISIDKPIMMLDVINAHNIQSSLLPLSERSGTSPGLIASFFYISGYLSIVFLPLYVWVVYRVLRPILCSLSYPPTLQLSALIAYQILPFFLQSPFANLQLFDEGFIGVFLFWSLGRRVKRHAFSK